MSLFDLQLGGSWGYNGVVKIAAKVNRPTNEVVLNVKEIDIQAAEAIGQDGTLLTESGHQDLLILMPYSTRVPIGEDV